MRPAAPVRHLRAGERTGDVETMRRGKTASSRFADGYHSATFEPAGSRTPRISTSISPVSIVPGAPADLLVVRGRSLLEAMASASEHRIVIKAGRVVARTTVDSVTHPVTDPGAHDREQSEHHRSRSDR